MSSCYLLSLLKKFIIENKLTENYVIDLGFIYTIIQVLIYLY